MDFDRLTSRPVIKSATSAHTEWERWLYENHYQRLIDGDGLDWDLEIQVMPYPDDENLHGAKWSVTLSLSADVDTETFLKTGVLDAEFDARLISLIGTSKIPLRMRPTVHEARGEKEARDLMIKILPELRDNIGKTNMIDMKRALIGRWIDDHCVFGHPG